MSTRQERVESLLEQKRAQDGLWRHIADAVARIPDGLIEVPKEVLQELEAESTTAPSPLHTFGTRV